MKTLVLTLALAGLSSCIQAQTTDRLYGQNGFQFLNNEERMNRPTLKTTSGSTLPRAHAVLPDGSTVFAANTAGSYAYYMATRALYIGKVGPDGQPDRSFGNNGYFFYSSPLATRVAEVHAEPDGRILVSGDDINGKGILLRLTATGTPDSSFGQNGLLRLAGASLAFGEEPPAVRRLGDGRYWLFRATNSSLGVRLESMMIRANGRIDSSYGTNGLRIHSQATNITSLVVPVIHQNGTASVNVLREIGSTDRISTLRLRANGTADSSFGTNGFLTYPFMGNVWDFDAADAGNNQMYLLYPGSLPDTGYIYRLQLNGQPDSGFGINGRTALRRTGDFPEGQFLWANADRQLFVSGKSAHNQSRNFLFSIRPDGRIDSSFGTQGAVTANEYFHFISGNSNRLITYFPAYSDSVNFYIRAFNLQGQRQSSYGQQGTSRLKFTGSTETLTSFLPLSSGGYLALGNRYAVFYGVRQSKGLYIRRYTSQGTPDPGFGNGGLVYNPDTENTGLNDAIHGPGNTVITGGGWIIRRFLENGSPDNSFGNQGLVNLRQLYPNDFDSAVSSVLRVFLQPNGRILYCGYGGQWGQQGYIGRLMPDGSADASFGTNGLRLIDVNTGTEEIRAIRLLPDNRIMIALRVPETNSNSVGYGSIQIRRLKTNGENDSTFGTHGIVRYSEPAPLTSLKPADLVLNDDGSILLLFTRAGTGQGGSGYNGAERQSVVIRYLANGARDLSFGQQGGLTAINGNASRLHVLPDGRLMVPLMVSHWPQNERPSALALARLGRHGRFDISFGTNGLFVPQNRYACINSAWFPNFERLITDPMPALAFRADSLSWVTGATLEYKNLDGLMQRVLVRDTFPSQRLLLDDGQNVSCNPLPFRWSTLSEAGAQWFELERSTGGFFTTVATLSASGTPSGWTAYSLNYAAPDTLPALYRLRLMSANGTHRYSNTVSIRRTNACLTTSLSELPALRSLTILPNPGPGHFRLLLDVRGNPGVRATVSDREGKRLWQATTLRSTGNTEFRIDLSHQPAGLYFLELQVGDRRISRRLLIVR